MCLGGAWEAGSETGGVTHFREMCHRRPSRWKCVEGRKEECALEGPGKQIRAGTAIRTSAKCATEGHPGGSALEVVRRNAPWRGLGGRFGDGRRYAPPGNVPQRAIWVEVRKRVEEGMCLGGAWEADSETGGVTHLREMCHRGPFGWKCVRGWKKGCALEGPGRQIRAGTAIRTSAKCATEGHPDGSALVGRRKRKAKMRVSSRYLGRGRQ